MRKTTEQKLKKVNTLIAQGVTMRDAIKKVRLSKQTYYKAKGAPAQDAPKAASEPKDTITVTDAAYNRLAAENVRLKAALADLYLKTLH